MLSSLSVLLLVLLLSSLCEVVSGASASACNSSAVWIEEGPYFVDGQLARSDVVSGYPGIPVNYTLVILDGRNSTTTQCTPLANVKVDTWEADWDGLYSDESVEGTLGNEYLRGYQLSNASGVVTFQSLYPGWYSGRTTHIHFRLRVYDGAGGALSYDETTQLFFDDAITDAIYASISPYSQHTGRDTYNTGDRIYTISNQVNLSGSATTGYTTTILLTIPLGGTDSNYILGNSSVAGGGGTTSSNTTSGGGGGGSNPTAGGGGGGGGGAPSAPGGGGQNCVGGGGGGGGGGMGGPGVCASSSTSSAVSATSARLSVSTGTSRASQSSASVTSALTPRTPSSSAAAATSTPSPSFPTSMAFPANTSTSITTGSLCLIFYSLPGTVDYPWATSTSLSFTYAPATVNSSAGQAVTLLTGSGTRVYTNRFGSSFSSSLSLATPASGRSNLLYLNSAVPFDTTGLTWAVSSSIQLPGNGPSSLYSQLTVYNSSGAVVEGGASVFDGQGQAYLSSVPGFVNITIGAANLNSLAVDYNACQATIGFTNGLRAPTQPSASNGAIHSIYTYTISDGASYSVSAILTLTSTSAFATTKDALGNPYQTVVGIVGNRTYTYLPTGATLVSAITGVVSTSSVSTAPVPSLRFYPYALLSSAAGVYSTNTAPFVDGAGLAFSLSPWVPANGAAPGTGPQYSSTTLRIAAVTPTSSAVLTEAAYTSMPSMALQTQTYSLLSS